MLNEILTYNPLLLIAAIPSYALAIYGGYHLASNLAELYWMRRQDKHGIKHGINCDCCEDDDYMVLRDYPTPSQWLDVEKPEEMCDEDWIYLRFCEQLEQAGYTPEQIRTFTASEYSNYRARLAEREDQSDEIPW